jgi:hypothetical protein
VILTDGRRKVRLEEMLPWELAAALAESYEFRDDPERRASELEYL